MRGLLPSKGLTQARSMALFSDALSPAVGFSGAWGSCLEWGGEVHVNALRPHPVCARANGSASTAHLTRRWALRESLPPTEVTLQV